MRRDQFDALGAQRVRTIAQFLQDGESVVDHGLAVWKEIVEHVGRARAEGFIVATDRRLIWFNGSRPSSVPYGEVERAIPRKRLATAELQVQLMDGQVATYISDKLFVYGLAKLIEQSQVLPAPANDTTTARHVPDQLALRCAKCHYTLSATTIWCMGCIRTFDWEASRGELEAHNAALKEWHAQRAS